MPDSKKKVRKKPKPVRRKLTKDVSPAPPAEGAPEAFNEISSITAKQMARAERAIENLTDEVRDLRKRKPTIQVESPNPQVVVELPPRPRIASVKIKYDQLGMPAEMVPVYKEV